MEFDYVIYLNNTKEQESNSKLRELGLEVTESDLKEERIAKFSFDVSSIAEIRETFVDYNDSWESAVCCVYVCNNVTIDTPPLLIGYEEFKKRIDEYNKESIKTK